MNRFPRDVDGQDLIKALSKFGYVSVRQTGSHVRLKSELKGYSHIITIPMHNPVKIGTLNNIFNDVASYVGMEKGKLIRELFK
ncbi:MAG: type II toxin-antitoxin system HicA family toxin [Clostridiales bacterium]|nr:type II toxin-antitoxin system HicA family toxin [Clostridiales bacterium]MCF8023188.1 type II toxin-antitoxin system HicA family toxin [Clostridiales bacterium]